MALSLELLPKILIAAFFIVAGFFNIRSWSDLLRQITDMGVPFPTPALALAIFMQIAGSLALFIPGLTAYGAWALIAFTTTGTLLFHRFWRHSGHEQFLHRNFFLGNFAVVGGLLLLLG
jgi:putative oxidoreductase